jgi:hypothetical protein
VPSRLALYVLSCVWDYLNLAKGKEKAEKFAPIISSCRGCFFFFGKKDAREFLN